MVPILEEVADDLLANARIIDHGFSKSGQRKVYVLETTEEFYIFLLLKYGKQNVWKR